MQRQLLWDCPWINFLTRAISYMTWIRSGMRELWQITKPGFWLRKRAGKRVEDLTHFRLSVWASTLKSRRRRMNKNTIVRGTAHSSISSINELHIKKHLLRHSRYLQGGASPNKRCGRKQLENLAIERFPGEKSLGDGEWLELLRERYV